MSLNKQQSSVGGAASNRGIWYQALWCALQGAEAKLQVINADPAGGVSSLRLVLEPRKGDVILERAGGRRVVQLKTLLQGTWSLKDVVEEVLPDLYGAVNADEFGDISYEFITEGRFTNWDAIREFFESLTRRARHDTSSVEIMTVIASLDDVNPLEFGGASGDFWRGRPTERGIFDRIMEYLSAGQDGSVAATDAAKRVWHLLSRFRVRGDIGEESVRASLGAAIRPVVEVRDDVPKVLDSMVGWIIKRSSKNETVITAEELFAAQGLEKALPITRWTILRERCLQYAHRALARLDYRAERDIRLDRWSKGLPRETVLGVTGGSGEGRTWALYALSFCQSQLPTVLVRTSGSVENDLQRAADVIWKSICGHDRSISFESIATRRADCLNRPPDESWVVVCVSGVRDPEYLASLLATPLEEWGIQVVLGCDESVGFALNEYSRRHPTRVSSLRVGRFSSEERDAYLRGRLGDMYAQLPADIRELLRSPQLAGIYCDLAEDIGHWRPHDEYALIERYWQRVVHDGGVTLRRGQRCFARLSATLLDGEPYPWPEGLLDRMGLEPCVVQKLMATGWLRYRSDDRYEVPHERLLQFAVAHGLVDRVQECAITEEAAAALLKRVAGGERLGGVSLAYALMDWMYLCTMANPGAASCVLTRLADQLDHHGREALHARLLPTLGVSAVPLLFEQLINTAASSHWFEVSPIVDGLASRPTEELRQRLLELLDDKRGPVRRAAVQLLALRPLADALDIIWQIHNEMQTSPSVYFLEPHSDRELEAHLLYDDGFDALRECARLDPDWIIDKTNRIEPGHARLPDLGYLAANLNDGGAVWRACKADLISKLPSERRRSFALNVGIWRDLEELSQLEQWVTVTDDLLGPASLRALALTNPDRAIKAMEAVPQDYTYLCRGWYIPRLFLKVPEKTRAAIHHRLRSSANPLRTALMLQGTENEADGNILRLLLDSLGSAIATLIQQDEKARETVPPPSPDLGNSLSLSLELIANMSSPTLLSVFAEFAGTAIEAQLVSLLKEVVRTRETLSHDSMAREPALEILCRIDGDGYRTVVNHFLQSANQYGKLDAIGSALRDHDDETVTQLRQIGTSDDLWDGRTPLLQMQAVRALASFGDAEGLLRIFRRLKGRIPSNIGRWLKTDFWADERVVAEATRVLEAGPSDDIPGAIIWLGLIRHTESKVPLGSLVDAEHPEIIVRSAIVALGMLGEEAVDSVPSIVNRLPDKRFNVSAKNALFQIGTAESREALLKWAVQENDLEIATELLSVPRTRERALDLIVAQLQSISYPKYGPWFESLSNLLAAGSETDLETVFQRCPIVRDLLREVAFQHPTDFWSSGASYHVIRGLAIFDPEAAYLAAKRVLTTPDAPDRNVFPPLLMKLNPTGSRDLFVNLATTELDASVIRAMADALRTDDAAWVHSCLASSKAVVREAGVCLTSALAEGNDQLLARLIGTLDDPDDRVSQRAEKVASLVRQQRAANRLAVQMVSTHSCSDKELWKLFDAVIRTGDPGFEDGAWPQWALQVAQFAELRCPALGVEMDETLKKSRKKAKEDAMYRANKKK